jgi:hypothetical protein
MSLSSDFTPADTDVPPPLIGALLRVPWETVRDRMLVGLHERGFTDLVAAHVDVWRYPGPENQRPSELATQTRMTNAIYEIVQAVETDWARQLGPRKFAQLRDLLIELNTIVTP